MKIKNIGLNFILFCIGFFFQIVVLADNVRENSSIQGVLMAKKTTGESRSEVKRDTNSNDNSVAEADSSSKFDASKKVDNRSTKPEELVESPHQGSIKNQSSTNSVEKKDSASADKQVFQNTEERKVAGEEQAYECSEFWTDEFSYGYIQVGLKCSSESSFCFAFFQIHRNYCEGNNLIRHYCDPQTAFFGFYGNNQMQEIL